MKKHYRLTLSLIIGLCTAMTIAGCSKNTTDDSLGGDGGGGTGETGTYVSCPEGETCSYVDMQDVIDAIVEEYSLEEWLLTYEEIENGNWEVSIPNTATCETMCLGFNNCLDEDGEPNTDAFCQEIQTECVVRCGETFNLEGLPEPDLQFGIPIGYNAIKVTVSSCLDAGNDVLYVDNSTFSYRNIQGTTNMIVPTEPDSGASRRVKGGSPVGRSSACPTDHRFKSKVTVEGINAESISIPGHDGEPIAITPLTDLFITASGTAVNSKEFTWKRPDLAPFGFREVAEATDMSQGITWILKDMPQTNGIHHLVQSYDNQMYGHNKALMIETYAPYDPIVEYEFLGFIKPKDGRGDAQLQ